MRETMGQFGRNLAAFLWLALRPIPKVGNVISPLLAVLGVGAVAVVGWITTPGSHKVISEGHTFTVPGASHWPLAIAGASIVVIVLFLVAGLRTQGVVASRPRLVFAGTDTDYRPVVLGPPGWSTASLYASGGPPVVTGASAAVIDPNVTTPWPSPGPMRKLLGHAVGERDKTRHKTPANPPNEYVRVLVKNEPRAGFGPGAQNVGARIEFLGFDDGKPLLTIPGRWSEAPQRADPGGRLGITHDAEQLTIEANGVAHELDVAFKAPGDKHFYASNDENSEAENHRLDKHRLDVPQCRVRVTLRPDNAPSASALFILDNGEHGLTLTAVKPGD
jgi:hypothetical protein